MNSCSSVCYNCGEVGHEFDQCTLPSFCTECNDPKHRSGAFFCPIEVLKRKFRTDAKIIDKANATAKAKADAKLKLEAEMKNKAEEKLKLEAEMKSKAEEKLKLEADVKNKAEEKLEADVKNKAEEKSKSEANEEVKNKPNADNLITIATPIAKAEVKLKNNKNFTENGKRILDTPYCCFCKSTEHFTKDKPGPNGKVICPKLLEYKCECGKTGHIEKNCPNKNKIIECENCHKPGHHVREYRGGPIVCPELLNIICGNCGGRGHYTNRCGDKSIVAKKNYQKKEIVELKNDDEFFPELTNQVKKTSINDTETSKDIETPIKQPSWAKKVSEAPNAPIKEKPEPATLATVSQTEASVATPAVWRTKKITDWAAYSEDSDDD